MSGDIKIFSEDNKKVLTVSNSLHHYNSKNENYNYFSKYFAVPQILSENKENQTFIEEYIPFRKFSISDKRALLTKIAKDYKAYFMIMRKANKFKLKSAFEVKDVYKKTIDEGQYKEIMKHIDAPLLNTKFPYIKLHGDLWTGNILI